MKSKGYTLDEVKRRSLHQQDPWWVVLVYDPIAVRLIYLLQGCSFITPNRLTLLSFLVGIPGVVFFALGARGYLYLVLGAISFQLFLVIDAMDGRLARLRSCPTRLGAILDSFVGGLLTISYMAALTIGGYSISGSTICLFAGIIWFALFAFNYSLAYSAERIGVNKATIMELIIDGQNAQATAEIAKSGVMARFASFMAKRRLRPNPTDIELFVIVFGIAPLTGHILTGIYIAAGYYLITPVIKLIFLSRPLLKTG